MSPSLSLPLPPPCISLSLSLSLSPLPVSLSLSLSLCVHSHPLPSLSLFFSLSIAPLSELFRNRVLNISHGIEDLGSVQYQLAVCLLLCWVICYCCVWKGIKSTGKVRVS